MRRFEALVIIILHIADMPKLFERLGAAASREMIVWKQDFKNKLKILV
jgi:hypothetical protein